MRGGGRTYHGLRVLPLAEEVDEEVVGVTFVEELREEIQVGHKRGLQDDGHVGSVEELDRVRALHSALGPILDRQIDAEALRINIRKMGSKIEDTKTVLADANINFGPEARTDDFPPSLVQHQSFRETYLFVSTAYSNQQNPY